MNWHVGVLVPARDEEERIGSCLAAVATALAVAGCPGRVCVVADRCRDATADVVRAAGVTLLVNRRELPIGEIRNLAGRRLVAGRVPDRLWLLSTDADTLVPPTWVRDHLHHAAAGAAAVAGAADLDDPHRLPADALARYTRLIAGRTGTTHHGHAYAANLGVRADAFLAVGGFPAVVAGEEHALLDRLRQAGYAVRSPNDVRVRTSARTVGRARGGLADMLAALA